MNLTNGMRLFSFGELWGPFKCECAECQKEAWCILMSADESKSLPEQQGPDAAAFILNKKLGTAVCDGHIKSLNLSAAALT